MSGDRALAAGYQCKAASALRNKGYYFDESEQLIDIKTGEGFAFKDQQHYDELGLVINEYIYDLLETQCELQRRELRLDDGDTCRRGFYFASNDLSYNQGGLLVLIHGTGVVRAGQWSRKLIINSSIEKGSQIPYIRQAKANNWAVVVMNTNQGNDLSTHDDVDKGYSPEEHAYYVWKTAIEQCPARYIAIVAHSYGGRVTSSLLRDFNKDFKQRVVAVALTDAFSVIGAADRKYFNKMVWPLCVLNYCCSCYRSEGHLCIYPFGRPHNAASYSWFVELFPTFRAVIARNWVTSPEPINLPAGSPHDCVRVSAGTTLHEETSWRSIQFVFDFIEERFKSCRAESSVQLESSAWSSRKSVVVAGSGKNRTGDVACKHSVALDVRSAVEQRTSSKAKPERKHDTKEGVKLVNRLPKDLELMEQRSPSGDEQATAERPQHHPANDAEQKKSHQMYRFERHHGAAKVEPVVVNGRVPHPSGKIGHRAEEARHKGDGRAELSCTAVGKNVLPREAKTNSLHSAASSPKSRECGRRAEGRSSKKKRST